MLIEKEKIVTLVQNTILSETIDNSIIFIDTKVYNKGSTKKIGTSNFTFPYNGFMVFIDLEPKVNWSHPCLYLFIKTNLLEIIKIKESFPPYYGKYPDSYSVLLRYGSRPKDDRNFSPY